MGKTRLTVAVLLVCVMLLSITVTAFAADYTPVDPDDQGKTGIVGGDTLTFSEDTVWANLTARWGVRVIFQDGDEWNNTELQNELLPVTDSGSASTTAPGDPAHEGWTFTGWERVDENTGTSTLNEDGTVTGINGAGPIIYRAKFEPIPPEEPDDPPVTPKTGSLTISKTVTGDLGDREKYFSFTVEFNAKGIYSYTGSKSGTISSGGTVQLKHGESITISGLPAGTSYSVTESGHTGYRVYTSGDVGKIAANSTSAAKFTNARSKVPITGGNSNTPLWGGLLLASAVGIEACIGMLRKKKRGGKHVRTMLLLVMVGVMAFSGFGAANAYAADDGAAGYTYGQYDMSYLPGTADTVTNMPANETGLTPGSDSPYTVSSTVPVHEGFEFIDWTLTWGTMEKPETPVDYSDALTVSKKATAAGAELIDRSFTITLESTVNIYADDPTGLFVENLTVTDTIEDEFVLNGVTAEILNSAGSVVSSQSVSASGRTVTHNFGNVQHGYTARLKLAVTAQPDFIGSNGVYTNVGLSGWTYKHTDPDATTAEEYSVTCSDMPQVNVRVIPITVNVGNATQRMGLLLTIFENFTDPAGDPIPNSKYDQTRGTWSVATAKIIMTENAPENWHTPPGEVAATFTTTVVDGVSRFNWRVPTNTPLGDYPVPVEITFTADGGPENSATSYGQGTITIIPRQAEIEIIEFAPKWASYTVRYLNIANDEPVADEKTVTRKVAGMSVTESAVEVDGYDAIGPTEVTIELIEGENFITFYYEKQPEPVLTDPAEEPTEEPTPEPTEEPTPEPTEEPTSEPAEEPTSEPAEEPTEEPTPEPTEEPTPEPITDGKE